MYAVLRILNLAFGDRCNFACLAFCNMSFSSRLINFVRVFARFYDQFFKDSARVGRPNHRFEKAKSRLTARKFGPILAFKKLSVRRISDQRSRIGKPAALCQSRHHIPGIGVVFSVKGLIVEIHRIVQSFVCGARGVSGQPCLPLPKGTARIDRFPSAIANCYDLFDAHSPASWTPCRLADRNSLLNCDVVAPPKAGGIDLTDP